MGDTEMAGGVFATTPSSPKAPAPVHNSRRSPGSSLSEWFMKYAVAYLCSDPCRSVRDDQYEYLSNSPEPATGARE